MTQETLRDAIARRLVNLEAHNRNPEAQLLALARSATDIVWWWNTWVWTYDPRLPELATIPMQLFDVQERFLHWLGEREQAGEDGIVSKSRDMGATWLCIGFLVHCWLFRPGFHGSVGSRKEELVDKLGDPDSIFEKARILLHNLPTWMLPKAFDWKRHDAFLKLINPANGAVVKGEGGDNIGRGGRSTIYFVDEAAFIEHPDKVERALAGNTNCRIYVSTSNGPATVFAQKRASGKFPVFELDWRDDPRRNAWELIDAGGKVLDAASGGSPLPEVIPQGCRIAYPFLEELNRTKDAVTIAQEYERDDTASVEGIVIPAAWVRAAVNAHKRVKLPQSADVIAGLDVADGGDAENALAIRRGPVVESIHTRRERGTTDTANWALDIAVDQHARVLNYDAPGVGAGIAGVFKARARLCPLRLIAGGINTGAAPTDRRWPNSKSSKEQFLNLKAELWWVLRSRFEKTFEALEQGTGHPVDELISIPDDPILIRQLSSQRYAQSETGKYFILSKKSKEMQGVDSPDRADALVLTFAPTRRPIRAAAGGERTVVTSYKPR